MIVELGQIAIILTPILLSIIGFLLVKLISQFNKTMERFMSEVDNELENITQTYVTRSECELHRKLIMKSYYE